MVEELLEAATESGESVVPADVRTEIEDAVIPRAHQLTHSQLRSRLRREIARRCTGKRAIRQKAGLRARVECGPLPGGMGYLYAILPADAVALAEVTLESMARVLGAITRSTGTGGGAGDAGMQRGDAGTQDGHADGLPAPPFARRENQSDASWRVEHRQWARAEALSALFRSLADGRPLPIVITGPPAAPPPDRPPHTRPASASDASAVPAVDSAAGTDPDSAKPTDWPFTAGGLDFTKHADRDTDRPGEPGKVIGWWIPPLLPSRQGRVPHLNLTVSLATLRGTSHEPAELAGYGPIPADLARQIADQITALYDAATFSLVGINQDGQCVHVGTRTPYRPSRDLRDKVTATHPHCRAPGCQRPSIHCDLDHRVPHAQGGPTCEHNLDPLCRFHHRLKTFAGWTVKHVPPHTGRPPGTLEWITTYGTHRYTEPEPWPDPRPNLSGTTPGDDESPEPPF